MSVRFFVFCIFCLFAFSCNIKTEEDKLPAGDQLVTRYCGSCHLAPEPALLDKETWKNQVLPAMARQLGLEVWQKTNYFQNEKSAISLADWTQIVAYYDSLAPQHLPAAKTPVSPNQDWSIFSLETPEINSSQMATTTLVVMDSSSKFIYTSDSETGGLYQWNRQLKQSRSMHLPSPAVQMNFGKNGSSILTCIGSMKAIDIPSGNVISEYNLDQNTLKSIASGLIRPIHTTSADINKDGLEDYIVSSFGHNKGGLFWLKQEVDKTFKTIAIREIPGATQSIAGDFNNDGWTDIMALFAHGDEGIWLFTNDKKGGFETKNVLRFPPVYGSNSFQLADMNVDGKPDIIYTSGDNSDYSRILKPYHGVYIFTNTGDFNFKQSYFYPINGCTKAIAKDFDMDGDIDIATIAFFADFSNNPSESFIYFENSTGKNGSTLSFAPHALPIHENGRWICMDANDFDGDGDPDIVLGNYSKGFLNQSNFKLNWNTNLPFVILENKTK